MRTAADVAIGRGSDAGRKRQIPAASLVATTTAAGSAIEAATERDGTDAPTTMESAHHVADGMAIATMIGQGRRAEPALFGKAALFHRRKPRLR